MTRKYKATLGQKEREHPLSIEAEFDSLDKPLEVGQLERNLRQYTAALPFLTGREKRNTLDDLRLDFDLFNQLAPFAGVTKEKIREIEQAVLPYLPGYQPERRESIQAATQEERTGVDYDLFVDA
jgi:hypothetical protein